MTTYSNDRYKAMIAKDVEDLFNCCEEVKKLIRDSVEDTLDYMRTLVAEINKPMNGPFITPTPKVGKRKGAQRIETIPEDSVLDIETVLSSIKGKKKQTKDITLDETTSGRVRRKASKTATDNIKKQTLNLSTKLRKSDRKYNDDTTNKILSESRIKRTKSSRSSSDEDEDNRPTKHSKLEKSRTSNNTIKSMNKESIKTQPNSDKEDTLKVQENHISVTKYHEVNTTRSVPSIPEENREKDDIAGQTFTTPILDDIDEPSMYEDAIAKHPPIMNSTMKMTSTLLNKMMNVTVVLEPLTKQAVLNETVTINKKSMESIGKEPNNKQYIKPNNNVANDENKLNSYHSSEVKETSKKVQRDRMQQLKNAMANKEFDDLITDDESSPEANKRREKVQNLKVESNTKKKQNKIVKSPTTSDDEVLNTPVRPILKENTTIQEMRNTYKSNVLFSPYVKESVKKRVQAFEQVCMNSPKSIDDAPVRLTRTKTRAMAAVENEKTVAQKLARKSIAKAKRISLARQAKDEEGSKENKANAMEKDKLLAIEKTSKKPRQKATPLGKSKVQLPMSVNRIPKTPINNQLLLSSTKALTASRSNIVTSMESLIPIPRTISKCNSTDKMEEKKRKVINDEDARRKRDEALKLLTEEKRRKRQEKEMKNKLAREAKEKQEMEKRLKAEREKEEKAKLAQYMQEKQREELERKRLAQLQRVQEKEEKRRQEERQKLQRLLEQEEAERLLTEQRRREQEAEKRREAEAKAQQQAAIEAMRLKTQMLTQQTKNKYISANKQQQASVNYILDSEPDDDDTDDESKPKHIIPHWAQLHVRKVQLSMQRYIPQVAIYKFFDSKKCTPDLTKLFIGIDRSKLKRTSSAIWKSPPRYSMMEIE